MNAPDRTGPILELHGITKRYGRVTALDGLDLGMAPGEVLGLLGPNGAGKTTAVKVILGLTHPSGGEGTLLGRRLGSPAARARVGYLPELFRFQGWLTGSEVLRLHLELAGLQRHTWEAEISAALAAAELVERADDRVATYSKGMQQRLGLVTAMLGAPRVVVLDEPGTALDPIGRRALRATIRSLGDRGTAVFVNSHQLGEVERVCDRVAILDRGRLQAIGSLPELLSPGGVRVRATGIDEGLRDSLARFGRLSPDGSWLAIAGATEDRIPEIVALLVGGGARVYGIELLQPSLEERFMQLLAGDRS